MTVFTPPALPVIVYELAKDARHNVTKTDSRSRRGMEKCLTLKCWGCELHKQLDQAEHPAGGQVL